MDKWLTSLVILLSSWLLAACAGPVTQTPEVSAEDLAEEEEIQHQLRNSQVVEGRRFTSISRKKAFKRMDKVAPGIQREGEKVCRQLLPEPGTMCRFRFRITESRDLNAYADGEKIYISRIMIAFADKDEELAMVLAHEYAHNIFNHSRGTALNSALGGAFGRLIEEWAKAEGYRLGESYTDTGAFVGAISYSIPFEKEADYVGMYIVSNAGYDMKKAGNFWRKWNMLDGEDKAYWNLTHPSDAERTAAMRYTIKEIEDKRRNHQPLVPDLR